MISKKEVQHIAKLARLSLKLSEEKKFQKELSSILDYIEKLKKVNISKTEPTTHPLKIENIMRQDKGQKRKNKKLLDLAPETQKGHIKVKSILK